jgi:hypothetical protein
MRIENTTRLRTSANPAVAEGSVPWRYFVLVAVCASVLAAGFFFAARQHFSAMELGIKNSNLRRQLDDLVAEKRRLMLEREVALAPAAIKRTARSLGFREIEIVQIPTPPPESNSPNSIPATAELAATSRETPSISVETPKTAAVLTKNKPLIKTEKAENQRSAGPNPPAAGPPAPAVSFDQRPARIVAASDTRTSGNKGTLVEKTVINGRADVTKASEPVSKLR